MSHFEQLIKFVLSSAGAVFPFNEDKASGDGVNRNSAIIGGEFCSGLLVHSAEDDHKTRADHWISNWWRSNVVCSPEEAAVSP